MSDLSQMIRWNTNFVRGLAESVLNRAKVIRSGLVSYGGLEAAAKPKTKTTTKKSKRTITAKTKKATSAPKTRSKSRRG